jgi:hypothetical protein
MQESDKRHFWEMLQGLASGPRGGEMTTAKLKAFWLGLEDLTREQFDTAIKRALRECDFFPSPKELRDLAGVKKPTPTPHYLRPAEDELERIETCNYHTQHGPASVAPDYVPWCRKCRRRKLAADGAGKPQSLGEVMQQVGLVALEGGRR